MGCEKVGRHVRSSWGHCLLRKSLISSFFNRSDADPDVLADYVLALVRVDAPEQELRNASIENLEDFLRERTFTTCVSDDAPYTYAFANTAKPVF